MPTAKGEHDDAILSRLPSCECGCTTGILAEDIFGKSNRETRAVIRLALLRLVALWPIACLGRGAGRSYWMRLRALQPADRRRLDALTEQAMETERCATL